MKLDISYIKTIMGFKILSWFRIQLCPPLTRQSFN